MSEPVLIQRERLLLRDLIALADDRARRERETETAFRAQAQVIEREYRTARGKLGRFDVDKAAAESEYLQTRAAAVARYDEAITPIESDFAQSRDEIAERFELETSKAKAERDEARWTTAAELEAHKNAADAELKTVQRKIADVRERMQGIRDAAEKRLREWRQLRVAVWDIPDDADGSEDVPPKLYDGLARGENQLATLKRLRLPRLFKGQRPIAFLIVFAALGIIPALAAPDDWQRLGGIGIGAGLLVGGLLLLWLWAVAKRSVARGFRPLRDALGETEAVCRKLLEQGAARHERTTRKAQDKHDTEMRLTEERSRHRLGELRDRRDQELRQAEERYTTRHKACTGERDTTLAQSEVRYRRRTTDLTDRHESESKESDDRHGRQTHENRSRATAAREVIADDWRTGLARAWATIDAINADCALRFPDWDAPAWRTWTPPTALPPAVRFGTFHIDLRSGSPGGSPDDRSRLAELPPFTLPALLPFPGNGSMLLKAAEAGRLAAIQAVQAVMLRFLTSLPPGKVRFSIIDPVGLGENFAAFMHLADYDEALVGSRIWTEQDHIEHRLADLTEHMENVIQKYLRNQYETIEEYNRHAGEVAEPFRVLVVANFPTNFSIEAARRLVSIASSGPRCGVYTLITVDSSAPVPQGFNLADLEQDGVPLDWQDARFVRTDADFGRYPLTLDAPPDPGFCTRILQVVGEQAKDASRVEVPFDFVAPPTEQWWTQDSRPGIRVPIGRAGATKRQYLDLGKGTAQHVLVAGKTGSGKSSLLHALITNLALLYSPDEVELYLIDFKKGVEFKTYATHGLPHARVVAIESEREFGLSVLQRLDAELKSRGDRFRELGVQDLAGYRQAVRALSSSSADSESGTVGEGERPRNASGACPRILLIVDEFQELFVEDDKIGQEAALLLDRLVRQGRAFGLHVMLGSQTLGGAYTLARSTIDQMAVRIALQCSEADAHLILSEDNSAARLLSRPGEAIYNDANGLVEGNDPFQVVWLDEERREASLRQIQGLRQQRLNGARSQIVFEGNAPAEIVKNPHMHGLLAAGAWPESVRGVQAWLGDAIAIKDPTAAMFRPQSGSNLLMIGQQDEAALAMAMASTISLAVQHAPRRARFYVLDGSPVDAPHAGRLGLLADILPHDVQVVGWRDLARVFTEIGQEVSRRLAATEGDAPAIYLMIYGLQRFRDLRRQEDEFSYSRPDENQPPGPDRQFATILRDGPNVGVHTLTWCDTLNNVHRTLERHALREFEMRVLFQMSIADSSNLIDSPLASKLGPHRALFYSEEQGRLEKFRPYGLPTEEWLNGVKERLRARRGA